MGCIHTNQSTKSTGVNSDSNDVNVSTLPQATAITQPDDHSAVKIVETCTREQDSQLLNTTENNNNNINEKQAVKKVDEEEYFTMDEKESPLLPNSKINVTSAPNPPDSVEMTEMNQNTNSGTSAPPPSVTTGTSSDTTVTTDNTGNSNLSDSSSDDIFVPTGLVDTNLDESILSSLNESEELLNNNNNNNGGYSYNWSDMVNRLQESVSSLQSEVNEAQSSGKMFSTLPTRISKLNKFIGDIQTPLMALGETDHPFTQIQGATALISMACNALIETGPLCEGVTAFFGLISFAVGIASAFDQPTSPYNQLVNEIKDALNQQTFEFDNLMAQIELKNIKDKLNTVRQSKNITDSYVNKILNALTGIEQIRDKYVLAITNKYNGKYTDDNSDKLNTDIKSIENGFASLSSDDIDNIKDLMQIIWNNIGFIVEDRAVLTPGPGIQENYEKVGNQITDFLTVYFNKDNVGTACADTDTMNKFYSIVVMMITACNDLINLYFRITSFFDTWCILSQPMSDQTQSKSIKILNSNNSNNNNNNNNSKVNPAIIDAAKRKFYSEINIDNISHSIGLDDSGKQITFNGIMVTCRNINWHYERKSRVGTIINLLNNLNLNLNVYETKDFTTYSALRICEWNVNLFNVNDGNVGYIEKLIDNAVQSINNPKINSLLTDYIEDEDYGTLITDKSFKFIKSWPPLLTSNQLSNVEILRRQQGSGYLKIRQETWQVKVENAGYTSSGGTPTETLAESMQNQHYETNTNYVLKIDSSTQTEPDITAHIYNIKYKDNNQFLCQISATMPNGKTGYATSSSVDYNKTHNYKTTGYCIKDASMYCENDYNQSYDDKYYEWYIVPLTEWGNNGAIVTISGNTNGISTATHYLGWDGSNDTQIQTPRGEQTYTSPDITVAHSDPWFLFHVDV